MIIEVLGSLAVVESEVVNKLLPFVVTGFQLGRRRDSEHKVSFGFNLSSSEKCF